MPDCQLLITSWLPDLGWLDYCLRSARKYWISDLSPIVVVTPECQERMPASSQGCEIIYEPQLEDHHLGQMFIKMNADQYTDAPLIAIADSDCLFKRRCSVEDFMVDGKPVIWIEHYGTLLQRSNLIDREFYENYRIIVGQALHIIPEHEFMREQPFIFYREHIRDTREKIESVMNEPLIDVMKKWNSRYFSEFNLLGAYCWHNHYDLYHWKDYLSPHESLMRQFHSWSQSPDEAGPIGAEVSAILSTA